MPSPSKAVRQRTQKVLYWERVGTDKNNSPTLLDFVELKVKWADRFSEVQDASGNTVKADVMLTLGRAVKVGSIMWKGGEDDLTGTSLIPPGDLYEVITAPKKPDYKGRNFKHEAALMRFGDTLPAVVG